MERSNWKIELLMKGTNLIKENSSIFSGKVPNTLALQFHKKMPNGAALREFEKKHLHLSYWETPYYNQAIERFLKGIDVEHAIIADIGCGDGRFTELLIRLGFKKIIATDIDLKPIESLEQHLIETGSLDKVLLINTGVENLPLKENICDAVLSIGVLYYLNENYTKGLSEINRIMKKESVLINSEPDLEGALYKSIFFESMEDVLQNYFERYFKEEKGETPYKFRLFTEEEITKILSENGFVIEDKHGLSLFPSIVRIMMVREQIKQEYLVNNEDKIKIIMNYLNENGKLNKHIIWKSKKK